MSPKHTAYGKFLPQTWVVAVGLTAVVAVHAETSPYYVGVTQAYTHDSNVFRQSSSQQAVSDVTSSTGLIAGIDQPIGRQRIFADASLTNNHYYDNDQLDYTGFGLNLGLDWSTIARLSGTLRYSANQSLADYAVPGAPQITTKNTQRTQQTLAQLRFGLTPDIALQGSLEHRKLDYSQPVFTAQQTSQNVAGLGVSWASGGPFRLGAGVRHTTGESPNFLLPQADEIDRKDVDLNIGWEPNGKSALNARISRTRETHSQFVQSNFSGVTGSLGWVYKATGRTTIDTRLSRDTGIETRFIDFSGLVGPQSLATNRLTTTFGVNVAYELTGKIKLAGEARRSRGSLRDALASGSDTTSVLSLKATYALARNLVLSCSAAHEQRSTDTSLSSAYRVNIIGCAARVTLR